MTISEPNPARDEAVALLPCPFCGGPAKTFQLNGTLQASCAGDFTDCAGFDVTAPVAMWNRRVAAKPPASGVDAVELVPLKWCHVDVEQYEAHSIIGIYEVCGQHWSFVPTLKKAGAEMASLDEALKAAQSHRDMFGPQPRPASLSPAATSGSEAGGEAPICYNTGLRCLAGCDGRTCAGANVPLNQWPEPASSPAGGDVREAFETCAAICEARAEYFDLAPSYREWTDAARSYRATAKEIRERAALSASTSAAEPVAFQQCVQPWMMACFGAEISADVAERNHRFLEESLELVQSTGCTASEAHQLVDYVYGRDIGETNQEIGGVMVTLAALCLALGEDMHAAGETELARIWTKVEKIRAKQAAKPKHSPLPQHVATPPAPAAVDGQRVKALVWNEYETEGEVDRWDAETALGTFYEISTQFDGYHVARDCTHLAARFDTLDEAKAAAQADYEARIRACLATDKEGA